MTRTTIVIAAALGLAVTLPAVSAQAQSPRTFVSAAGSDSNPCSFAAPCRHFQAAVNATSAGGEVDALDPAVYGPIIISHAITIEGQGWSYIAPPSGGAAITITAPAIDNISIHGVSLNGAGISGNTNGIVFADGGGLEIADCVIRNFTQTGVVIGPGSSVNLLISNTRVLDNSADGLVLEPAQVGPDAGGYIYFSFDHLTANNNGYGIFMHSLQNTGMTGTITNSVINNSNVSGISFSADAGAITNVLALKDSSVSNNILGAGISVSFVSLFLSHSFVANNSPGIALSNNAKVYSAGDNDLFGDFPPISGGSLISNPKQ
jgi:hypothetical protein